jgi:endonuclease III
MMTESMQNERKARIAAKLLQRRDDASTETPHQKWDVIADYAVGECPKSIANKFLLGCLVDFQTNAESAWIKAYRFVDEIAKRPDEIWLEIADYQKSEWESEDNFKRCGLHWMHSGHNRLWQIAKSICFYFGGDARRIWQDCDAFDALCRLNFIGTGEQISRMIVGALKDSGHISGKCDVKADVYVCRVLGRAILGDEAKPETAVDLARQLHPADPWQLDNPLWHIGKSWCHASSPTCTACDLRVLCKYARRD